MRNKDNFKIDLMSNIDDDIIDKHTKKRFELMNGKKSGKRNKALVAIIALAACLALLASALIILLPPTLMGQIPVYQGMTVSNEAPNMSVKTEHPKISRLATTSKHPSNNNKPTHELPDNIPVVEGSDRALYYAKPNEDIYITIHITNPDQFEILSFTLNDVKYQSYMFEPGSDSENLILKLNVGDVQGMVDYTIDAIKYVDGTQIKDVIMDGEKTVRVGVYPEEQPNAEMGEIACDLFEISLSASVSDPLSLIKNSNGSVFALLYEGDELIREKTLDVGQEARLSFDGLDTGKSYTLRIVAYYDALDEVGFAPHLLAETEAATRGIVEVTNVNYRDGKVVFDFNIVEGYGATGVTVEKTEFVTVYDSVKGDASEIEQNYCYVFILATYSYDFDGGRATTTWMSPEPISVGYLNLSKTLSNGEITKEYSDKVQLWNESTNDFRYHYGVDYELVWNGDATDANVYATFPGIVTDVYWDDDFGSTIVITSFDESLKVYYQSVTDVQVEKDDIVNGGQVLASVSSEMSEKADENHVHIVVYENGEMVDPEKYFN